MEKKCGHCGQTFLALRRTQIFCRGTCRDKARRQRWITDPANARACLFCSQDFQPRDRSQKYCGRACAQRANNPLRKRPPRQCATCGSALSYQQKKFCSATCVRASFLDVRRNKVAQAWLAGAISGSKSDGSLRASLRLWLIERAGTRCSRCGWNEPNPTLGRPILTVNHKDGDWRNNTYSNLEVLCYNCHTLTPNFGALNAGSKSGWKHANRTRASKP